MIKKSKTSQASKTRKPRYAQTPTNGATFGMWLIDLVTGTIMNVERGLTWEQALEWQGEWIERDRQCVPLIVRESYEMPKTLHVPRDAVSVPNRRKSTR